MSRRGSKRNGARAAVSRAAGALADDRPHSVIVQLSDAEHALLTAALRLAGDVNPRALMLAAANAILVEGRGSAAASQELTR